MNKLFPHNNKNNANTDDVVTLAIKKAKQEQDEMLQQHAAHLRGLEHDADGARAVMQAMVLVARISQKKFFALLDEEVESWNLRDLKYVAEAIQNQLQSVKEKQQQADEDLPMVGLDENPISTVQRLYTYIMIDPAAKKETVVQVIKELHKELSLLEEDKEKLTVVPITEIQQGQDDVEEQHEAQLAPSKIVEKGAESTATSITEEIEPEDETDSATEEVLSEPEDETTLWSSVGLELEKESTKSLTKHLLASV